MLTVLTYECKGSARDLKMHMYTNSYTMTGLLITPNKLVKKSKSQDSIIVYLGKYKSLNFECGLYEAWLVKLDKI